LACAVFCRAILEGALKEIADPQSETSQSIPDMDRAGGGETYFDW
jgi:hypothetical protein